MKLSEAGRKFIEGYEKREPKAYRDGAGKWTIGIGHLITEEELRNGTIPIFQGVWDEIYYHNGLSNQQMDALFAQDIAPREVALSELLDVAPTQQQFDAMLSLLYNIGSGNFVGSTVRRKFNEGDTQGAADAFPKFNKVTVNGVRQVNQGLVKRRAQERAMFLNGTYDSAH